MGNQNALFCNCLHLFGFGNHSAVHHHHHILFFHELNPWLIFIRDEWDRETCVCNDAVSVQMTPSKMTNPILTPCCHDNVDVLLVITIFDQSESLYDNIKMTQCRHDVASSWQFWPITSLRRKTKYDVVVAMTIFNQSDILYDNFRLWISMRKFWNFRFWRTWHLESFY